MHIEIGIGSFLLLAFAAGLVSGEEPPKAAPSADKPAKIWQPSDEEMAELCRRNPDVPRGSIHTETFVCKTTGLTKKCCVYTPPGYDESDRKYPLFYLLHGIGDDETGWRVKGFADNILDNMLAKKKMIPMIVVMPNGFVSGVKESEQIEGGGIPWKTMPASEKFDDYLIKDVMRVVEAKYRGITDRDHRAIAGLSMGGRQALDVGLNHLELFSSIGNFSGAVHTAVMSEKHPILKDGKALNSKLKVFYHACGTGDFLYRANQDLIKGLKAADVRHIFREMEGAHVWPVWERSLAEILPLISHVMAERLPER
jgi:enterochelin esterase-like enzyme